MLRPGLVVTLCIAFTTPAPAIVGGETIDGWLGRPTVAVWQAGRGVCTGVAIGADLVLTAAHCVSSGQAVRVGTPRLPWTTVHETVAHPDFVTEKPRVADLALLKLSQPLLKETARLAPRPVSVGNRLIVLGYGIADDGKRDMRQRMTTLTMNGLAFGLLQLVDHSTANGGSGSAGCGGDSGGPVFSMRSGVPQLVGIVQGGTTGCRGATYVTPISRYSSWIMETADKLGSAIGE